jgi:hypothetical protein
MSTGHDEAEILARLADRAAGYLAEGWRPTPGGAASALLAIVAQDAALIRRAMVETPGTHELRFLDVAGVSPLPPQAARAPLAFTLADDAPLDVALPAGSEVAAQLRPPLTGLDTEGPDPARPEMPAGDPEPVVFGTERTITLTRARLASVCSLVPAMDAVRDHGSAPTGAFTLFGDLEQMHHELYLGHDTLFELPGTAEVSLMLGVDGRAARAAPELRWEYLTEEGWLPFEPVVDQTRGMTVDGEVLLRKVCGPPSQRGEVNGIDSCWIRARVTAALPQAGLGGRLPVLDTVAARVSLIQGGLPLDAAFADGQPVDTTKDFLPFGAQPSLGSVLLIACDEAFKRSGATLAIAIRPSAGSTADSSSAELIWEYSVGPGSWSALPAPENERLTGTGPSEVGFERPDDWHAVPVNGAEHYWLRVRIAAGDYGGPSVVRLTDGQVTLTQPAKPPVLAGMTVSFGYRSAVAVPQRCLTRNLFTFVDHSEAIRWGREPFSPFQPVPEVQPAVYLGYVAPLPAGLVSLYADVPDPAEDPGASPFTWEYRSSDGWAELAVEDRSAGFRQAGTIAFVGPSDLVVDAGPQRPLHWIRARLKTATATPEPLSVTGLHHNATTARHRREVRGEVLGRSDGTARLTLRTQHAPVLGGQRVEVQEWVGTGQEWESRFGGLTGVRYERDLAGSVSGVWVTWTEMPHLYGSVALDRHYSLDRARGLVRFGDGVFGMIPPPGAVVAVDYDFLVGPAGNVPAGALDQPYSALPYVEAVTNPVAAAGGTAGETEDGVRRRGRQRFRHRDRGVSAEDLEWLAVEASPEVAVARCLPLTGPDGTGFRGRATVVIAPRSTAPMPQPSAELVRVVRGHLIARACAAITAGIRILGPTYEPVSVAADVVVDDPARAAGVEDRLRRTLDALLHPLTGGPDGTGWRFGEPVHLSQIALAVEDATGVDFAELIQVSAGGRVSGDRVEIAPDRIAASGRHLLRIRLGRQRCR